MHVRILEECTQKMSALSSKQFPKGWTGTVDDGVAVEMILAGLAEDTSGEVTPDALEAEIARRQAIIAAGGDPDAEPAPAPAADKKKSGGRKAKAAPSEPEA